jgi:hypothetical protein
MANGVKTVTWPELGKLRQIYGWENMAWEVPTTDGMYHFISARISSYFQEELDKVTCYLINQEKANIQTSFDRVHISN